MSTILQSVMVFFIYNSFNTQNIAVKNKIYMFFCIWILHLKKKLPLSHTQSWHLVYIVSWRNWLLKYIIFHGYFWSIRTSYTFFVRIHLPSSTVCVL